MEEQDEESKAWAGNGRDGDAVGLKAVNYEHCDGRRVAHIVCCRHRVKEEHDDCTWVVIICKSFDSTTESIIRR
jgi:hypothetical protein